MSNAVMEVASSRRCRQGVRFVVVGAIGFAVDTGLTIALIAAGFHPLLARIPALGLAIVATWLMNGTYTFENRTPLGYRSLVRYTSVAMAVAAANYLIYAVLITAGLTALAAIAIASLIGMSASFFGYREFAFRSGRGSARPPP